MERFARRLSNFDYVKTMIRLHVREKQSGGCYVWRIDGRIAAFCALNYLNPDDAWLYGMRVDPAFRSRGVATQFTHELIGIAGQDGRTWVGLNTSDQASHRPVFRVAEKLGMKLEGIFGNDVLSPLRRRFSYPRLKRHPDIFDEFLKHGRSTFFHDTPGWFWSRTLPARRDWINQGGYVACGVPLHIDHRVHAKGEHSTTVSLLELPYDPKPLFSGLLAYARRRSWIVVNYPVEWKRKVRRTWRELIPSLRQGRRYYSGAERVYGKYL